MIDEMCTWDVKDWLGAWWCSLVALAIVAGIVYGIFCACRGTYSANYSAMSWGTTGVTFAKNSAKGGFMVLCAGALIGFFYLWGWLSEITFHALFCG